MRPHRQVLSIFNDWRTFAEYNVTLGNEHDSYHRVKQYVYDTSNRAARSFRFCAQCACVYACVLFSRQMPFFGLFFIKLASDFIYIYTHTYRINGYFYYLHYGSLITSIYREHCFFKVKGKNDINYSRLNETCLLSTCACDRTYVSKTSILHRTFAAAHVLCC